MLAIRDNLAQCVSALDAHKLRASLTMLGLTMGVATLITVMTIVEGANLYVENHRVSDRAHAIRGDGLQRHHQVAQVQEDRNG